MTVNDRETGRNAWLITRRSSALKTLPAMPLSVPVISLSNGNVLVMIGRVPVHHFALQEVSRSVG
jgi:hypothetical protein